MWSGGILVLAEIIIWILLQEKCFSYPEPLYDQRSRFRSVIVFTALVAERLGFNSAAQAMGGFYFFKFSEKPLGPT